MEISEVKELYFRLTQILDQTTTPPTLQDLLPFRERIDLVQSCLKKIDDDNWWTTSPWHAAVTCIDIQAEAASGIPVDESKTDLTTFDQLDGIPAHHVAFRGEGNYRYSLCPSYFRTYNTEKRPVLNDALSNFAAMLKYASDHCFANANGMQNFDIQMFVGAAQHYLGNTPLMDWTTDPCVAVAFASNYEPKKDESVVYAIPTFKAVQHNATFYLPPPFVERLYLQRGFFIETKTRNDDAALQNVCQAIRFKEDKEFAVIRDGKTVSNLMAPHSGLDHLAEHCKQIASNGRRLIPVDPEGPVEGFFEILKREWEEIGGIPEFLDPKNGIEQAERWCDAVRQTIERCSHLKTTSGPKVNTFVLLPLVCSNLTIIEAVAKWLRIQEAWSKSKLKDENAGRAWESQAKVLEKLIQNCHSH